MPAGGKWTVQNKQRPGAYIDFVAVSKPSSVIGERGIVACGLPMTWGPADSVIELLSTDLVNGTSLAIVGCTTADIDESLPYRLLLESSYKALLYRLDTGGAQSTATIQVNMTVKGKYAGITGNKISLVIVADSPEAGKSTISVRVSGVEQESFVVATFADCVAIDSNWVVFSCTEGSEATVVQGSAGIPLEDGTNGAVNVATFPNFVTKMQEERWNCVTMQSLEATAATTLATMVKTLRDTLGRNVQCVVYNDNAADHEGVIATKGQGFNTATDAVTAGLFPLWVAGITAGAAVNQSNTCRVVKNAVSIINPIADNLISDMLKLGWFVLSYLQDGTVVVEQDINTFVSFTEDKNYAFSKNRVIRTLDEISNFTTLTFNKSYAGKVSNTAIGRNTFKAQLISKMDTLAGMEAIENFAGASDISIDEGETIEAVVVTLGVQPVDSMEKLYMTVYVNA